MMDKLFSIIERTDRNPKYHLENDFTFYDRVDNESYQAIRNILNSWFKDYPNENKKKLTSDFKVNFPAAYFELFTYTLLRNLNFFPKIEIEDSKTKLTPDFLCKFNEINFYIESTVVIGESEKDKKIDNIKKDLYNKLSELDMPKYFLYVKEFEILSKKYPKKSSILKLIQKRIDNLTESESQIIERNQFEDPDYPGLRIETKDLIFETTFIHKIPEFYGNLSHPIGIYPVTSGFIEIEGNIPKAIKKKIDCYKKNDEDYIIFVNQIESNTYSIQDLLWHLFGTEHYSNKENKKLLFESESTNNLIGIMVTCLFPMNINNAEIDFYANPKKLLKAKLLTDQIPNHKISELHFKVTNLHNILGINDDYVGTNWQFG